MTLGVGILGFGVMGRVHAASWDAARRAGLPVELVGIHSRSLGAGGASDNLAVLADGLPFDSAALTVFPAADDLLSDPRIHVVSICTHTDSHVPLALRALDAGKHVLVEKPVGLSAAEVRPLAEAAAAAPTVCMPAMCMRFWPGWPWLRDRIRAGDLGEVRRAHFERLGQPPGWARHFYGDVERCGGALHDLHVHDADFVRWTFGDPAIISASGDLRHVRAEYAFGRAAPRVSAEGGWVDDPDFAFRMRYRVEFADATAEFAHDRDPPVLLTRGGETTAAELPAASAYDAEVRHFARVALGEAESIVGMGDALGVAGMLERERAAMGV